jgi:hypothetical protein
MARYRRGRQNFVLHAAIVAVAAATTSLWLGRAQAGSLEHVSPNFDGVESFRAKVHVAVPAVHFSVRARPRPSADWLVVFEDPPSVAVTAPDMTATAPRSDQGAGDNSASGAASSDSASDAAQAP